MAYPELVSMGVSKSRKCKWLVKVGASNGVTPLIKQIMAGGGGGSGQPEHIRGYVTGIERLARSGSCRESVRGVVGTMNAARSRHDWLATVQSGRKQTQSRVCTPGFKPGVHTNDFAPNYGRRAKKLGHASLATVFRHGRLTFQPILWENLESPVLRYQPITTAVNTDARLITRWHHDAYKSPKEDTRWLH